MSTTRHALSWLPRMSHLVGSAALLAASVAGLCGGCAPSATGAASPVPSGTPGAPMTPATPAPPTTIAATAATPDAQALAALADEYWRRRMANDPIEATLLGYPGFDDKVPDPSDAARARYRASLVALQQRLAERVRPDQLDAKNRVTRGMLMGEIERDVAVLDCNQAQWALDPRDGPQVALLDLAGLQKVDTVAAGRALVARWRAIPAMIDQMTANLLRALGQGKVAARSETARVERELNELLARPDADWPLVAAPLARAKGGDWSAAALDTFRADLLKAVSQGIRPSFDRYRDAVTNRVMKKARDDDHVGISNVPGGEACYRALAQAHTSLRIDPRQVHDTGLAELRRIRAEILALGPTAVGSGDFDEIRRRLRGEGPEKKANLFFSSRDEIEAAGRATLARATAAEPRFLGRLPRTPCEVRRIEPHDEKDAPVAYYRQPTMDGTRPGIFYVNTYDPTSRPRFESEALAFHESVPGHHVQIALAQEMTGVPEFQKNSGVTAFVEGWGLYAERLADELGLYSSPLTRLGRLSLESWRAARLVVDTGIHALGWSRARAVQFMADNTLIAGNNIENEVDRYIGWPGQALAYKLGELEIVRLRHESEAHLGAAFDVRAFHDTVLGNGAISLPVLREEIERWWARAGGKAGPTGATGPTGTGGTGGATGGATGAANPASAAPQPFLGVHW